MDRTEPYDFDHLLLPIQGVLDSRACALLEVGVEEIGGILIGMREVWRYPPEAPMPWSVFDEEGEAGRLPVFWSVPSKDDEPRAASVLRRAIDTATNEERVVRLNPELIRESGYSPTMWIAARMIVWSDRVRWYIAPPTGSVTRSGRSVAESVAVPDHEVARSMLRTIRNSELRKWLLTAIHFGVEEALNILSENAACEFGGEAPRDVLMAADYGDVLVHLLQRGLKHEEGSVREQAEAIIDRLRECGRSDMLDDLSETV